MNSCAFLIHLSASAVSRSNASALRLAPFVGPREVTSSQCDAADVDFGEQKIGEVQATKNFRYEREVSVVEVDTRDSQIIAFGILFSLDCGREEQGQKTGNQWKERRSYEYE